MKTKELIRMTKKLYAYLNGNKTIIFGAIWLMVSKGIIHISAEWMDILNYLFAGLTGSSFVDHIRKGYLSSKKGS